MNPLLLCDFYKVGHVFQYPEGTTLVYSNLTPRKSRIPEIQEMVFFGLQYFIKEYLIDYFNREFFSKPKEQVLASYGRIIKNSLGGDLPTYKHIEELHDLGYLPVRIKAVPEGTLIPMRVACLTIVNTKPEFFWVTNFLETLMSACLWQACTSATIAFTFRKLLNKWAEKTGMPKEFVQWQGHDFSFRGMSSPESAIISGMGHLLSFTGTDTIPAIVGLEEYYNANSDKELIGGSVVATEHSISCAGGKENEQETFERLITKVQPNGIISVVSDTWDLWRVLTEFMQNLKDKIMARDGKVVIRPDSGDPVKIICGDPEGKTEAERKGVIELLWDTFGGTTTVTGHKLLDSHVGAIYGDSINLDRAERICAGLAEKGFASQCLFGVGSFTYQMNTRDTFGMAIKATYCQLGDEGREIFKEPKTDDGTKNSAKGLLKVRFDPETKTISMRDQVSWQDEKEGMLKTVFENGKLIEEREQSLKEIRRRISYNLSLAK